jgi:hypothetical protein
MSVTRLGIPPPWREHFRSAILNPPSWIFNGFYAGEKSPKLILK